MKARLTLLALACLCSSFVYAQWEEPSNVNYVYTSDNVGIGVSIPAARLDIYNGLASGTNLILSANYYNKYRWRFNTVDRGNAIDLDITASDNSDVQEYLLKLSRSNSGRPELTFLNNWLVINNGKIGLSTATPKSLLSLGTETSSMLSTSGITLGKSDKSIEFLHSSASNGYGSKIYGVDEENGLTSFRVAVRGNSSTWKDALYIKAGTSSLGGIGYIGVNNNYPKAQLDLHGSFKVKGDNLDGKDLSYMNNSGSLLVGWNRSRGHGEIDFITNRGPGTAGGFEFIDIDNSGNENLLLKIKGDGSVGIGTTKIDAGYKLSVNGSVRATEVKVEAYPWPDYVFDETYDLKSLAQTEQYIKENKHLPNLPSAAEVADNGIELGDMNAKLLEKIEELTLLLIKEQKDRVQMEEKLLKRIESLESEGVK